MILQNILYYFLPDIGDARLAFLILQTPS